MIEIETIFAAIVAYCNYDNIAYTKQSREACFESAGNCMIINNKPITNRDKLLKCINEAQLKLKKGGLT